MKPSDDLLHFIGNGLTPVSEIDVRALSDIYDESDIYLSIYLPTASRDDEAMNETYIASRWRTVAKVLDGGLLQDFERTMEMAREHISYAPVIGERGRIIYASEPMGFLHVYRIGVVPERTMVLDTSPFLLPLARLRDDYEDYAIILMDSREAKLYSVRSDVVNVEGSDSIDLMNRHKKGGMSQMRFNRLRRGAISAFISDLVEDIEAIKANIEIRGLVLAGPGEAKKQLLEALPQELQKIILGVVDISMDTPVGELLEVGDRITLENERTEEKNNMETLSTAIMRSQPAAYGAQQVRDALNEARVNVLLILRSASIPGWICERCQNIRERAAPPKKCPFCGGPTSGVDVIEELYELAQRTGAEVEFVTDSEFLASLGGIAALLRY